MNADPQTDLRDRIAEAVRSVLPMSSSLTHSVVADAVLAVLPSPADRAAEFDEMENAHRSFPNGVKPALCKALAAADRRNIGRLPIPDRKRYSEQADAVLRLMGWRENQLTGQYQDALKALRAAEGELRRVAAEAQQQECSASISGSCLREAESETACDTEAGECVHGGRPGAEAQQQADTETPTAAIARVRAVCDRLRRASVLADGQPHTDRERGVIQAVDRVMAVLDTPAFPEQPAAADNGEEAGA